MIKNILLMVVIFLVYFCNNKNEQKINISKWRSESLNRSEIAEYIIKNNIFNGVSKDSVINTLGLPAETIYFSHLGERLVYYIEAEGGYTGIDSRWLVFKIQSDTVFSVMILKD